MDLYTSAYLHRKIEESMPPIPVEYLTIQGSGCRGNTGYFPTNRTGLRLKVWLPNAISSSVPLCGQRTSAHNSWKLALWVTNLHGGINVGRQDPGVLTQTFEPGDWDFDWTVDSSGTGTYIINGVQQKTFTQSQIGEFTADTPICLGTLYLDNRIGSYIDTRSYSGMRVYSLDITESGVLQRTYRPFRIGQTGLMIDTMNSQNVVIPDQTWGTYNFMAGPDV